MDEALADEVVLVAKLALVLAFKLNEAPEAELPLPLELSLILAFELWEELVIDEGPTAELADDSVVSRHETLLADVMVEPQRTTHNAARRRAE